MNRNMTDETPQEKINRLVQEGSFQAALNDMGWSYGELVQSGKDLFWEVQIRNTNNQPPVLTARGDTPEAAFKAAYTLAAPFWTPPDA